MDNFKLSGPYKATKLWNEMVQTFRGGMPLKKHRRHMKVYENCFTGLEAVSWLHGALQRNPNIGPETTKDQITQLLNKFLIAGIFKRINLSNPSDSCHFKENGDIYEFCNKPLPNAVDRLPLSSTSINIPLEYRYNDQYHMSSNNELERNALLAWKQDTSKFALNSVKLKDSSNHMPNNVQVNTVYCNKTGTELRPSSCTQLRQAHGISIENVPVPCGQVRFAGIQKNPCNAQQRKPKTFSSRTHHQNDQHLEMHDSQLRTQRNSSGYDQLKNHQYDPSSHNIHAYNGQWSNYLKHAKQFSAQHEQVKGQLKYSQHGIGNCDVRDLHLVTAQHDHIQGIQHKNVYNRHQDSSPSMRPRVLYKHSDEVGCSQSQEMYKCQFQNPDYKYYATKNRLGLPQSALHVPDSIEMHKVYSLPEKYSFPKIKHKVDYNQHFINEKCTIQPQPYGKPYDSSVLESDQARVSGYMSQNSRSKSSLHGPQYDQYVHSHKSKAIIRHGVDNKHTLEQTCRTSAYPIWTNSSHSVVSTNRGQCGNVKASLATQKLSQQNSNNSNAKNTEITKPLLMQVVDTYNGPAQAQPTSCSSATADHVFRLEDIWKTVIISRLQELVIGLEISTLLPASLPGEWLLVNGTQPEVPFSQLPQECLSVLNYLLHGHQEIPEEAVYAVKEYFCNLNEPLTTFELYTILAHTFEYVEYVNSIYHSQVQNYEEIPPSKSIENLVLGMASPCVVKTNNVVEGENISECEHLVSGSMLLSTVLPPNSCFETAFTSDSPITRIVPQRTMDTLHFKRNVVTSMSARCIKSVEPCSRERRPSLHSAVPSSPASSLKRNASAPNLLDPPCMARSKSIRVKDTRASSKRTAIKEKSWWHSRKIRDTAARSKEGGGLQHCRNKSGGYVNPGLSLDDVDPDLASQELDYAAALETLSKLMQCSRSASETGGVSVDSSSDCSSSYYTAASSSADSSCQILADFPETNSTKCTDAEQWTQGGESLGVAMLQLLLLMIPPCNRTQLQLLLHFLNKLSSGTETCYSSWDPTQIAAIFCQSIVCSANNAEFDTALACRMVTFLVARYDAIMRVPSDLQTQVDHEAKKVQQQLNQAHLTYCEQVSCQQFEQQKLTGSQLALSELLDQILADRKMGLKEKKKRMKMFKESYPHIYRRRFPDSSKQEKAVGEKPRGMLHFVALSRLKSLRV